MRPHEVSGIISRSLQHPNYDTIRASQKACGYTVDGFDPKIINRTVYEKGSYYRPIDYPAVSPPYLNALFTTTNTHAPPDSPNLYLRSPAEPTFLESPSIQQTANFRASIQKLKEDGNLACEQALALRAREFLTSDPSTSELCTPQEISFLEGAAATLAATSVRNLQAFKSARLISRSVVENDQHRELLDRVVIRACEVGPTTDMIERPCHFFVLKPGESVAVLQPGQVSAGMLWDLLLL